MRIASSWAPLYWMCIGHYSQGISRVDLSLVYDQRGDLEGGAADEYDCASWTTVLTAAAPFIFLACGCGSAHIR